MSDPSTTCRNGHENEPGSKFCEQCGVALVAAAARLQPPPAGESAPPRPDGSPRGRGQPSSMGGGIPARTVVLLAAIIGIGAAAATGGLIYFLSGGDAESVSPEPTATLPATVAIVAIYLAVNVAYLYVSPIEQMTRSPLIAADTMGTIFGPIGVALVSVIVTSRLLKVAEMCAMASDSTSFLERLPAAFGAAGVGGVGAAGGVGVVIGYFFVTFFLPAIARRGPFLVRALVCVRWPRTGRPRR